MTVTEHFTSGRTTKGAKYQDTSYEKTYIVTDETTEAAALAAVQAAAPATYTVQGFLLYRKEIDLTPEGGCGNWTATVTYNPFEDGQDEQGDGGDKETGESEPITFDISAGQEKLLFSKAQDRYLVSTGAKTSIAAGGPINLNGDTVEGVDIIVPQITWQETWYLSGVNANWLTDKAEYVGTMNDASFRGADAGEVLLMGLAGKARPQFGDYAVTFTFGLRKNKVNATIAGVAGVDARGWDYVWIISRDAEWTGPDGKTYRIFKPLIVCADKIYDETDFSQLGIGTT